MEKLRVRFWGVRGSIASPGPDTSLTGGNTSCVEVQSGGKRILLDAGTGLRVFGREGRGTRDREIHLLLSHFHSDHLAGLPFFPPLFRKATILHLYGPAGLKKSFRKILSAFFSEEFFPVPFGKIPTRFRFHTLKDRDFLIPPFRIASRVVNHPGRTLGYRIEAGGKGLVYLSDHEPVARFAHLPAADQKGYEGKLLRMLRGADLLIHDAQFTDREYPAHRGWGHSPWSHPVSLARASGVRRLILFHHAPEHSDRFLSEKLRDLHKHLKKSHLSVSLAREGETVSL